VSAWLSVYIARYRSNPIGIYIKRLECRRAVSHALCGLLPGYTNTKQVSEKCLWRSVEPVDKQENKDRIKQVVHGEMKGQLEEGVNG
jgi:hypothetical protein